MTSEAATQEKSGGEEARVKKARLEHQSDGSLERMSVQPIYESFGLEEAETRLEPENSLPRQSKRRPAIQFIVTHNENFRLQSAHPAYHSSR